ncbi:DUF3131 domain-containing protein [Trichocoleus sp. FACHB-591]|uniref:DUF3131 domain-containing protein n=1 Tax=Trichocoleus sp. FACHB-591 TaxID=2692872 RepID=UPI001681E48C|nr:DUF3131 domain-containing protein [Trichocoleus sp. FACHB-591]MBD2098009.1 DUF3131 domain-containing protein [Trichocoleus sp. FACHB-591]
MDFEPPSKRLSLLAIVGGVLTAAIAIAGLETLSRNSRQAPQVVTSPKPITKPLPSLPPGLPPEATEIAKLDSKSWSLQGTPVSQQQLQAVKTPYVAAGAGAGSLTPEEQAIAQTAWKYFEANWNEKTGLVNAVDGFASITMWDQAAALAALVSAKELGIVPETEFNAKMSVSLKTLATMPLYKGELPNKVYNAKTLLPVGYGQLDKRQEIGWSALDIGRMAIWLKIIGAKYPEFQEQTEAVWKHWKVDRLTKDGDMYGTAVVKGKEQVNQEGRLGYENYAAFGLKLWGMKVDKALDYQSKVAYVNLYGQGVPYDRRDYSNSQANNYVLSEPFILDGIETGFQSLPKPFADRVLEAQAARYRTTKKLTAVTEDNLDRAPYFVYSTLFVNGEPWSTITPEQKSQYHLRFLSTKAAVGWHVLYNNDYTQKLFDFVNTNMKAEKGWYNGFYELLNEPNAALTANNNGVVLESLLYRKVGKPLTVWAGVQATP